MRCSRNGSRFSIAAVCCLSRWLFFLGKVPKLLASLRTGFFKGRVTEIQCISPQSSGMPTHWKIMIQTITSNNGITLFGDTSATVTIADFSPKLIPIDELPLRPISEEEQRFLTERGTVYRTLSIGAHHKAYLGPIQVSGSARGSQTARADSRIMVDIQRYYITQMGTVPTLTQKGKRHTWYRIMPSMPMFKYYDEEGIPLPSGNSFQDSDKIDKKNENAKAMLCDTDLWVTSPSVPAFSFRHHAFGTCHIELMSDISWREEAWNQLVLPPVEKELIRALILQTRSQAVVDRLEHHRWKKKRLMEMNSIKTGNDKMNSIETGNDDDDSLYDMTDIVQGKGGGCTLLLHGKSGTGKCDDNRLLLSVIACIAFFSKRSLPFTPFAGKTLTAEAVAEFSKRPLYAVTVGELGTTPAALEDCLTKILDLASCWNAIILLDEANVFLSQRGDDIERNGLVSIFLRTIEYFNGVLVLTSNLADKIDEAFLSRISASLRYNELGAIECSKVWHNFLGSGLESKYFDFVELGEKHKLNGRQIRSAVRVAQALA